MTLDFERAGAVSTTARQPPNLGQVPRGGANRAETSKGDARGPKPRAGRAIERLLGRVKGLTKQSKSSRGD